MNRLIKIDLGMVPVTAAVCLLAGACGGDLTTGGETGDPGVRGGDAVHTTAIVPETPVGPPGHESSCGVHWGPSTPAHNNRLELSTWDYFRQGDGVVLLELMDGRLAAAEQRFGLAVIERSDDALLVSEPLLLDAPPLSLHELADGRLVLVTVDEAILVDVGGSRPEGLDAVAWHDAAMDSALVTDGQAQALHVLVKEHVSGCGVRPDTALVGVTVSDGELEMHKPVALGTRATAVVLSDGRALVVQGMGEDPDQGESELEVVLLRGDGGAMLAGPRISLGGAARKPQQLRLDGTMLDVMVLPKDEDAGGTGYLKRFDIADSAGAKQLAECSFAYPEVDHLEGDLSVALGGAAFGEQSAAYVVEVDIEDAGSRVSVGRLLGLKDSGACDTRTIPLSRAGRVVAVPQDQFVFVALAEDEPELGLELHGLDGSGGPHVTLSIPIDHGKYGELNEPRTYAGAVNLEASDGAQERTLLAIPHAGEDPDGEDRQAVEWVSLSETSLTARGSLPGMWDVARFGDMLYTTGYGRLTALALDGESAPSAGASAQPWPNVERAVTLPTAVGQLRGGPGQPIVELVAPELYPRELFATIDVAWDAVLFAVAGRLVTLEAANGQCGDESLVRVFDVDDPTAPQEVGSLTTTDFPPCKEYDRPGSSFGAYAHGHWLVLRESRAKGADAAHDTYDFHIINLGDPTTPSLTTLERPDPERSLGVVLADGVLHYSYGEPVAALGPRTQVVYVSRMDLTGDAPPTFSQPVNVPGEVIAVSGERAYTRSARWDEGKPVHALHRVVLTDPVATIEATFETGDERPTSAWSAGDQALVTVAEPSEPGASWGGAATRLLSLDPQDLALLGELPVTESGEIFGMADQRLVVFGFRELQIVDTGVPSAPALTDQVPRGHPLVLDGDELLYMHGNSWDAALIRRPL